MADDNITEFCPIPSLRGVYQRRRQRGRGASNQPNGRGNMEWREGSTEDFDDSSEDHFSDDLSDYDSDDSSHGNADSDDSQWSNVESSDALTDEDDGQGSVENSSAGEESESENDYNDDGDDDDDDEEYLIRDYLKRSGAETSFLSSTRLDSNLDDDIIFRRNIRGKTARVIQKLEQQGLKDKHSTATEIQKQELMQRPWIIDLSRLHQNIVAFMSQRGERTLPIGALNRGLVKHIKKAAECHFLETSTTNIQKQGSQVSVLLRKTDLSALPKPRNRIYRRIESECMQSDSDKLLALKLGYQENSNGIVLSRPMELKQRLDQERNHKQRVAAGKKQKRKGKHRQTDPVSSSSADGEPIGRSGGVKGKRTTKRSTPSTAGGGGGGGQRDSVGSSNRRHGSVVGGSAAPIDESNVGHKLLQKMGWSPGQTLGTTSKDAGLKDPLTAVFRAKGRGLGFDN